MWNENSKTGSQKNIRGKCATYNHYELYQAISEIFKAPMG